MLPSVGVVDAGENSRELISSLRNAGFSVTGVWGSTQHQAQVMAHKYDVPYATSKIDELLLREDVDLLVVLCPPHHRAEVAVKALSIGKHVLCEAPAGLSKDEADRMVNAAQYYPKLLSLMKHELRFVPTFVKMKRLIEEGYCGNVLVVECRLEMGSLIGSDYDWMCDQAMGGGILTKYGSHIIDLVSFLTNQQAESVNGTLKTFISQTDSISSFRHITSDDFCAFQMKLTGGIFVTVTLSTHMSGPYNQYISVLGSEGRLIARNDNLHGQKDGSKEVLLYATTRVIPSIEKSISPEIFLIGLEAYVREIKRAFEESVDKDDRRNADLQAISSAASFEDGLYTSIVLDCIKQSSKEEHWVRVQLSSKTTKKNPVEELKQDRKISLNINTEGKEQSSPFR
ncbi:hypothetical protein QZH41_012862 [Actinostola sp. cb2023]|nr:hypothetical protein QZH41_012862 [Actinostola sp. cb2023]